MDGVEHGDSNPDTFLRNALAYWELKMQFSRKSSKENDDFMAYFSISPYEENQRQIWIEGNTEVSWIRNAREQV